ncbi:MAG: hypothetical protein V1494_01840 [Candidatus Diapherotrites archaeon]
MLFSVEELRFAQQFPFTSTAKRVVKENGFSLEDVPPEVFERSKAMLLNALKGKAYKPEIRASRDDLLNEILAFPVAKILLSLLRQQELSQKFANSIAVNSFKILENEKNEILMDLSDELEVKANFLLEENAFASIPLAAFLSADFPEEFMKLVNKNLDKGKVFLNKNDFARFLSKKVKEKVISSPEIDSKQLPQNFKQQARQLLEQLNSVKAKRLDLKPLGKVSPDFFPECMAALYSDALRGKSLAHNARFDLAVFLAAVGMTEEQITEAFSKMPNFNKKITSYQVKRIIKSKYSPPSCATLRSHGIACANCEVKHPLQYYRKKMFGKTRQ